MQASGTHAKAEPGKHVCLTSYDWINSLGLFGQFHDLGTGQLPSSSEHSVHRDRAPAIAPSHYGQIYIPGR